MLGHITRLLVTAATLSYGCSLLAFAWLYSLKQRETWFGAKKNEKELLESTSHRLWSLHNREETQAHKFITLGNGLQFHYLTPQQSPRHPKCLIIFLHGFPDSCHLFSRLLGSNLARDARLVALDLPGCGGSDSLDIYGANQVLNAVVEAIVALKKKYQIQAMKCILVGHDWGGVVSYRIAAGSCGLVDNVVVMNSLYAQHVKANISMRIYRALRPFQERRKRLTKASILKAMSEIEPIFSQLRKSHYTFLLQLPFEWAKVMPSVALSLLRYVHLQGSHRSLSVLSPLSLASSLSSSFGPTHAEIASSLPDGSTYGRTVQERASTLPPGDLSQRFLLYRQGLILDDWVLSHTAYSVRSCTKTMGQTPAGAGRDGIDNSQVSSNHRFNYPMVVIFGLEDEALDSRIVLDGLEDYFMLETKEDGLPPSAKSQIVRLAGCGHWALLGDLGASALQSSLERLIE